ncbi:phytoene dehydrogenase [Agromyces sp. Root1464]|uniref:phytoene desaturase family protein n=1 Tax=Agromyces sp. Root1464 TaxID=1736467 RepID=UPI0006FF24A8|nr:phytoene desaturase family protein [Agromyces sp. Root1464]KQZ11285.1 phytoene dehydrogenase [Agromyces sp. Root1464]
MSRVAIVGGGIAGLATAALLARDGHDVTVYEANETVGGRAGRWDAGGFRFDTGPSWYLMPEVFEHFYRLMGTSAAAELDLVRLEPGYRVLFEHRSEPLDLASDRTRAAAAFEAIEPGAGRRLEQYLDSAGETTRLALDHFLYNDFSSPGTLLVPPVLRRIGRLGRLLLQPLDRFIARRFRDPRLRQVLGYPAVFLGTSPAAAPSLYHLMSHFDLDDGVFYPQGGFREVIDSVARLAQEAGARIVTGARVTGITVESGAARGIRYVDRDGIAHEAEADVVVSAADLHHTETALLPPASRSRSDASWRRADPGPGAVLVMLGVRGELPQLLHHTLLFTEDWAANFDRIFGRSPSVPDPASLYVCRPSATDPSVAPAGHENLFVLVPVPADPSIGLGGVDGAGDDSVERIADAVIAQIASWAGVPDLADRVVVRRTVGPADFEADFNSWRGSALGPAHVLRQSAFLRGRTASSTVKDLYFAGATTVPGIGLPMCLISAELVAKALLGERGAGPLAEPTVRSVTA